MYHFKQIATLVLCLFCLKTLAQISMAPLKFNMNEQEGNCASLLGDEKIALWPLAAIMFKENGIVKGVNFERGLRLKKAKIPLYIADLAAQNLIIPTQFISIAGPDVYFVQHDQINKNTTVDDLTKRLLQYKASTLLVYSKSAAMSVYLRDGEATHGPVHFSELLKWSPITDLLMQNENALPDADAQTPTLLNAEIRRIEIPPFAMEFVWVTGKIKESGKDTNLFIPYHGMSTQALLVGNVYDASAFLSGLIKMEEDLVQKHDKAKILMQQTGEDKPSGGG